MKKINDVLKKPSNMTNSEKKIQKIVEDAEERRQKKLGFKNVANAETTTVKNENTETIS